VFAREHGLKMGSIEALIRHRLETEHTVERVDSRDIETEHGPFRLHAYHDRLGHALHFALVRGEPDADTPTLVRVQVRNALADVLRWRRPDFGPAVGDVLAAIAAEGRGALVLLDGGQTPDALLERLRAADALPAGDAGSASSADGTTTPPARGGALVEWRRNGAGSQILADIGLGKLRVLGTARKQVGLAGFGLEVVEYHEPLA
jgi:3,4-dihydroxy 2-butanone 4-phosphate synthase/GTP cyclohydrolase II